MIWMSKRKKMELNITNNINGNIDKKFKALEERNRITEEKIENQERRINQLERGIRKKNVVFFGVEEVEKSYGELERIVLDIINNKMNISCNTNEIECVIRIGKKKRKDKTACYHPDYSGPKNKSTPEQNTS